MPEGPTPTIPLPWSLSAEQVKGIFVHSRDVYRNFQAQHEKHKTRLQAFGEETALGLFRSLRAEGMTSNEVGLDFTRLQHLRYPDDPGGIRRDENVTLALQLLGLPRSRADVLLTCDQFSRGCSCRTASSDTALRSLHSNGYARINDWGLDMKALSAQVQAAIAAEDGDAPLPALGPLLGNSSVAKIISSYLGGAARFDGHRIVVTAANQSRYAHRPGGAPGRAWSWA